jgi:hypothetical protein
MESGFPGVDPLPANVAARKATILWSNVREEDFRSYASLAVNVREPYKCLGCQPFAHAF